VRGEGEVGGDGDGDGAGGEEVRSGVERGAEAGI
jgi:hypothetical protein